MSLFSSLTNRIFMAAALLAVLSIGFAIYFVNRSVTRQAEAELQRGLEDAGTLVEQYRSTVFDNFAFLARLIADLPKLKAAIDTGDAPTVEDIARDYQKLAPTDLFVVTEKSGRVLAAIGRSNVRYAGGDTPPAIASALAGQETSSFWPHPEGVLQVVTLPVYLERAAADRPAPPEILGTLSVGFLLDDRTTAQFKSVTESEIAFVAGGRVLASTLPRTYAPQLAALVRGQDSRGQVPSVVLGTNDYAALVRPIATASSTGAGPGVITAAPGTDAPVAIILRSRTERLRFLGDIHTALAGAALFAVLVATVLSYGIARTVTRPLGTITAAMRAVADTGDLTRKVTLRQRRWDDEDARLLASTFNTLTDSVARFQHEVAQRERLSSLGRLSTVIAHEIRNPLMIIKASLRTVRREDAAPHERAEAASDIDEEITRLNRVVNDVLDFARPIKFECRRVDLNQLCAEAATAAVAGDPVPAVRFVPDPAIGEVTTDVERLRLVLVNMITNARHAVVDRHAAVADAKGPPTGVAVAVGEPPPVEIQTGRIADDRVTIAVRDRGIGIGAQDLARVFDPYFTTKRSGSGLGLPIAKNIIEGLGGSIAISSRPGVGTEVRLMLPRTSQSS
jgi:signal transduction histidine kinase